MKSRQGSGQSEHREGGAIIYDQPGCALLPLQLKRQKMAIMEYANMEYEMAIMEQRGPSFMASVHGS